ncbi:hypothetical protein BBJ29_002082 [Phytophthora kernoviae]|uniref:SAM domain-containing protein n=1 Tax=Phytophthora kernoviae TaxID=325452 RepID=A0A3F2RXT2_9STRA|nr:hypothetical protein BBJ29_002082 [Phytophthora kernoviae]RLN66265.1 hypothetical protein BBP00_00002317 [Phytophthora kernoviae]
MAHWSAWSREDVGTWLGSLGLSKYTDLFQTNEITGDILPELTRDALRDELGIAAFGDRVRISQSIEALISASPGSSTASNADVPQPPQQPPTPQNWPRDENVLDLVVLHAAPLVIKDSRLRIYPMEKLDLEAERREISNSLLTDVQHKAIHVRFDIATADILRSLMTAWKHLHEPTCTWMRDGSRHSQHSATQCCCKGHSLAFPHDESSKFLLLGTAPHDVVLFGDIPNGTLRDYTPRYSSNIPSMHGQFIACLGAPGIGKSSLVISVAHFVHSRRMFPDGVFYVDLEGQKLSTVRYAIAQSIGMPAADTDEEVFAELGNKNCLLVLDKVEELLDEDENKGEELLHQLISVAPNLRLLLASRRNMHIPSVTPYSLSISELPLHTATELLSLVAPGCSAKLAERLAKICGCLPLAIRVLFAEEEAGCMGGECFADPAPGSASGSTPSSFVAASIAKASHAYRFEGTLALFDKERANIESAMRLAHELTLQSIEQMRDTNRRAQQDLMMERY